MSRRGGPLRNILRNTSWQLAGKGVGALLSVMYLALVTHSLGLEGFGQFSLALGAGQAVELLVTFQSWQIVVRYGMPHLHAGRSADLARLLRFTTMLDIGTALISAGIVIVVMPLLGARFGWDGRFVAQATACCVILVLSTHWTPIGVLLLHDRFAAAALADTVTPVTRFLGAIVAWFIAPDVIGFLAVWAAAELLTAIAYWFLALRLDGLSWRFGARLRWSEVTAANPDIGAFAATTNLKSSLDVGGKQIAVLLVGFLLTPAAVGGFRLAQRLAQALATISQLLARAIFPELMRGRANASDTKHFDRIIARTLRLTGIGGIVVVLMLVLVGRQALGFIAGAEFVSAYPVLLLLGTGAAIEFAAVGFEPGVIALGRPGLALSLRFIATIILLAGIVLLTPMLGTMGAGVAALTAAIFSALAMWSALRRLTHGAGPSPR